MNAKSRITVSVAALLMGAALCASPSLAAPAAPTLKAGMRSASVFFEPSEVEDLAPGDHVDVLVTFEAKTKEGIETVTATILQNVLVLKTDKEGTVHLAVNMNEAQYLKLSAVAAKRINLVRRPPGDEDMHPIEMASFRKLFN